MISNYNEECIVVDISSINTKMNAINIPCFYKGEYDIEVIPFPDNDINYLIYYELNCLLNCVGMCEIVSKYH